jgi:large subunit ribosomal protein L18
MDKKETRLRRARKTRAKIAELKVVRLSVHRTNSHIYAQVIAADGSKVLASASTAEKELRDQVKNGGSVDAAALIGKRIAEKARCRCGKGCVRPLRVPLPRSREGIG